MYLQGPTLHLYYCYIYKALCLIQVVLPRAWKEWFFSGGLTRRTYSTDMDTLLDIHYSLLYGVNNIHPHRLSVSYILPKARKSRVYQVK